MEMIEDGGEGSDGSGWEDIDSAEDDMDEDGADEEQGMTLEELVVRPGMRVTGNHQHLSVVFAHVNGWARPRSDVHRQLDLQLHLLVDLHFTLYPIPTHHIPLMGLDPLLIGCRLTPFKGGR
jgi:hypothetical protein